MVVRAPAKLNLCLYMGETRADGLHELRSVFCPLMLADRIEVFSEEADEVVCEGVAGRNLAATALAALRDRGWRGPPLRIEIDKRIPVAAGLGGGSADAAAVLRLAQGEVPELEALAEEIGADVTSQLEPRFALVGGAGERVETLPDPGEFAVVLIPFEQGLSTAEVYAEADRLGLGRPGAELDVLEARIRAAAGAGVSPLDYPELLVNDLQQAALSLRPEIGEALGALADVGAKVALLTGSGPTAVGLFENIVAADRAAGDLPPRWAGAIVSGPARPA
jgi:4-diphosphocytidyl-2-C-methyl-D-erythritol kinase